MLGLRPCFLLCILGGCQQDPLFSEDHIAGWANSASALGVFTHGYEPLAIAEGEIAFEDPGCPMTSDDGTTLIISGNDCVDVEDKRWVGSAVLTRNGSERSIRFEGYGKGDAPNTVPRLTGDFTLSQSGPEFYAFGAQLSHRGGVDTDIDYQGTVAGAHDSPTLWNGQGTISRDSRAIYSGTVQATTVDQLRDNSICPGEGISGSTTLVSEEHEVDILYDGADDCDGAYSARWRRDGVDKGLITGVSCASVAGGSRPTPAAFWIVAILGLMAVRRRSRSALSAKKRRRLYRLLNQVLRS